MESQSNRAPLIAIVGETGSGKTAFAIWLAKRFNGEVIAADSRTVYKEMDISTAKPDLDERDGVAHHLLDIATPDQGFTAAEFKRQANEAITGVWSRGHVPFLVGGSGLYADAVLYDYEFRPLPDPDVRRALEQKSVDELWEIMRQKGIQLPNNSRNRRHLIRSIETGGATVQRRPLRPNTLIIGLQVDRQELQDRLVKRVELMVKQGLVEEIKHVAETYGWDAPALQSIRYQAFRQYLANESTIDEAMALFVRCDLQLSKRQRTWFKRNADIHWLCKKEEAVDLITTFLNKVYTDTE